MLILKEDKNMPSKYLDQNEQQWTVHVVIL